MPKRDDIRKVLIIGSGPIVIGQACEFDYSGTQACKALRELGYQIVLVNSNPATIMTDPGMADVTYIEPLNVDTLEQDHRPRAARRPAAQPGRPDRPSTSAPTWPRQGILEKYGVQVIGVNLDAIERGEDRIDFKNDDGPARHRDAAERPPSTRSRTPRRIAAELGYPVVIRPAYTMGGTGGGMVYNVEELRTIAARGIAASLHRPDPRRGVASSAGRSWNSRWCATRTTR